MRNNYQKKHTNKHTHTKKKNNKTKKQHVHQQKNLTTALVKNKSVMELSLQLAGQFQRTFKRRVSYIQDGCRLFYKRNKKVNEISLNSLLLPLSKGCRGKFFPVYL